MKRFIALGIIVAAFLPNPSGATEPAAGKSEKDVAKPKLRTVDEKREWLREQVVKGLRNSRQVRHAQAQVDAMTPQQIEVLTNSVLAQQLLLLGEGSLFKGGKLPGLAFAGGLHGLPACPSAFEVILQVLDSRLAVE